MRWLIIVCLLFVPLASVGEDRDGIYIVKGAGTTTCDRYASKVNANEQMFVLGFSWVQGYLTAYNNFVFDGQDLAAGVGPAALRQWLEQHCLDNPRDDLAGAANALVNALLQSD